MSTNKRQQVGDKTSGVAREWRGKEARQLLLRRPLHMWREVEEEFHINELHVADKVHLPMDVTVRKRLIYNESVFCVTVSSETCGPVLENCILIASY